MFSFFLDYLKGYVNIKITGFSIERFLNLCLNKNILLYNIEEKPDGIFCKISIKDFKNLRAISKKTGCKYRLVSKYGMPFFILKNKNRIVFVFGAILFVFLLYFFSSFIWFIEINGNKNLDNNQILAFCKENNLYLGAYKNDIDAKNLQTEIKNHFPQISWVNISIKGTKAKIDLSENIEQKKEVEFTNPCDIIATETGVITDIVTRTGRPLVKEKDTVKKGDVLVSGELLLKDGEQILGSYTTHSDADIKAKTQKSFSIEVAYNYYIKEFTGKEKTTYSLIAFDKVFPLSFSKNVPFNNYDTYIERTQLKLSENFYLPFIIKKTTYKEYNPVAKKYSVEEAKVFANKLITEKIISDISFETDILDKKISYQETENSLIANINLTLIEDIGEKSPVKITYEIERSTTEDGASQTTTKQQ